MSEFDEESFDPNRRRLCPDGSCVGLLDDNGRCSVCGRVATEGASSDAEWAAWENGPDGPNSGHHTGEHEEPVTGGFDPGRKLCPDGDCVGVLDSAGRCPVCGRDDAAGPVTLG